MSPNAARLLPLAGLLALTALAPARAQASEAMMATDVQLAGDPPKRVRKPGPLETGFYGELAWRPAMTFFETGVVPQMRLSLALGGKLSSRFKLAAHPHVDIYLDRPKASGVGIDMIGTVYTWKRAYVRWGFGAHSGVPNARDDRASRPGLGGLAGLGYEWHLKKKVHMGAGLDLDVRWLKDGSARMALISGIHFAFE
ncbi:MAG: hypothetical protein H6710_03285 [Myxococcales bacterium]|nr:hypothetical protein [Myxococcales bacterium]MCB9702709.1 hypothetical protein [Myxococcales bacterium]